MSLEKRIKGLLNVDSLRVNNISTGTSVNNLGVDSNGNVVIGTTGDTDTNTFVTGGTLSGNDLILEKNNGVDVNPIDLSGLVSGKTDLTLFNSHTGDTNNPHQTSFSNLTATAHTHTISDVINLQSELDSKTNNSEFVSHTGDTTIHFTKSSINLSDLGSTAHTHTLSEITDFNSYSGNVQTQLDNKLNISEFNTYTGNTETLLNTKISGATNLSSEGIFAQKNGLDLEFKGITSTGGTVNISSNSNSVNLEVTTISSDKFVSGGTYNGGTKEINFVGNSVDTTFDVDLTSLVNSVSANTFIISGTYIDSTDTIALLRNDGNFVTITGITDTFVTGQTFSNSTYILSTTRNDGTTFNTDLSVLATDVYVVSGVYNPSTGIVTYTNSSGGTFQVSGFTTGMTDSYTTAANLNGETIEFDNNIQGSNLYSVSLTPILSGKTDLTLFNTHTGDTTIHFTKSSINLSDLGSTAHTHTLSEITDFNSYSGSVQTQIDGKTDLTLFNSHTGDTNNPHQTSFSNLTSTAHTHTISDVTNLQSELDSKLNISDFNVYSGNVETQIGSKTDLTLFNSHTGDTNNPHQTSFSNLSSTAHTHTLSEITDFNSYSGDVQTQIDGKLNITDFNSYSGNVQTQIDTKIENGINSGGANEVFSGKSGTDLYFRTISGGSNTTISTIDDIIRVDVTIPPDTNTFVTGGTYNESTDTITLTRNDGNTIEITGVTDTFTTGGTYNDSTAIITFTKNDSTTYDVDLTSLPATDEVTIEVNSLNEIALKEVVEAPTGGTRTFDSFITITSGLTLNNLGTGTSINNLGIDINGNIVIGTTGGTDTNTYVTGGTFSSETLTLDRNDGGSVVVTGFTSGGGDNFYVTGFTYNDANTFTISRNGGLGDLSVTINTLTGLTIDGVLSASTYTGITLTSLDDVTSNIPSTPDNTYQGRLLYFDAPSNQWLTGEEYVSTGNVTIWGKKGSAGTIDKGLPVYITGFDGDLHEVELANATTATTMPVIGFTAEDFDNAGVYPLVTFGKITGLDTTSTVSTLNPNGETWVVNDVLYMAKTDGGLTKFRPTGTNTQIQRIAKVLNVGTTNGQIFIFNTARTAGLPNLTTGYLWVGNGDDLPQEVIRTDVGITTTGFTYNDNNTFTITDDNGGSLTSTFNQVSGLTINGDLDVIGDTTLNTLTATSITSNSAIDVFNGHINLRDNSYFLQGRTVADGNVSLIGVDNQDRVFVGNAGYDTYIDSDTIVDGSLTATTLNITTIGTGTLVNNLGVDASGNVVSGNTNTGIYGGNGTIPTSTVATITDTISFISGNVGIGTTTPTDRLFVSGSTGEFRARVDRVLPYTTELYAKTTNPSGSSVIQLVNDSSKSIVMGVLGSNRDASVAYGGESDDAFMFASSNANNLHIFNGAGTGTEDSINFYAGNNAAATPHLHIQGSGSTKGYVGIGTETPSEILEVVGNTKISGTLNIGTLGTGTSVNNLGIDGSGNVVNAGGDIYVTGGTYSSGTLTLDRNDGNSVSVSGFTSGNANVDNFYYSISNSVDTRPIFEDTNVLFNWDETGNDLEFQMKVAPGGSGDMRSLAYLVGGSTQNTYITTTGVNYDVYTAGVSAGNRLEVFITAENDVTYPAYHVIVYNTGESVQNTVWIQRITRI